MIDFKSVKHIFFDLDNTLWDFNGNSKKAFDKILKLNEISISIDDFMEAYLPVNDYYWKLYRTDKVSLEQLRYERFNVTFQNLNYEVSDEIIYSLTADYIKYLTTYNDLIIGAKDLLLSLHSNYNLHIITNGHHDIQIKKIEQAGLRPFFQNVISSDEVGVKKPNPKIFNYALEKSNALPKESLMIGDDYEADIVGAKNAGFKTCFLSSKKKSNKIIDLHVTTLSLLKYVISLHNQ